MHEFSVVDNLLKIIEKICQENNVKKVLKINLKINPYSCLDEDNLNFIFSSIVKNNPIYKDAKIKIKKALAPIERGYIIEDIEIEV